MNRQYDKPAVVYRGDIFGLYKTLMECAMAMARECGWYKAQVVVVEQRLRLERVLSHGLNPVMN